MRLFHRTETYDDGSTYRYKVFECEPFRRLALARWSFTRKGWHPRVKRLARLRALYWVLVRFHDTEICGLCGGPVGLVYHAPDIIWEHYSGFPSAARFPSGEAGAGCLCVRCLTDLAKERGVYLGWTCSTDFDLLWQPEVDALFGGVTERQGAGLLTRGSCNSDAGSIPAPSALNLPWRAEHAAHGPSTIYDTVDVGWIVRVKESLPHKAEIANFIVDSANRAAASSARTKEEA